MFVVRIKNKWSSSQGFTLIELLVVVAIIGILSALLMSNFIGVRQRARDAQRKSDLRQIQSALELYRADVGSYPNGSTATTFSSSCSTTASLKDPSNSSTYMQKIPCDPLTDTRYTYSSANGTSYTLIACLENGSDSQKDSTNVSPCDGTTNFSYTVANP